VVGWIRLENARWFEGRDAVFGVRQIV